MALNADRKRREKAQEAAREKEAEARGEAAPKPDPPKKREQRPNWLRRA